MKRYLYIVAYWCVAAVVLALIFVSFDYRFSQALFMASLFLPALLCLRLMLPQVRFTNRWEGVRDMVFILAGAIILTILLLLIANISTLAYSTNLIPDILVNPIFISLLLLAVALPQIWLEKRLSQQAKQTPQEIDFISDRRHVKVMMDDITYVESNDSEVWIHTLSGESHRTKTTITQWSSILDNGNFIRIHRAYIVNRLYITESDSTTIRISDHELPISRKYRDGVRQDLLVTTE
jgi:uncharacterized membrane protein YfhO